MQWVGLAHQLQDVEREGLASLGFQLRRDCLASRDLLFSWKAQPGKPWLPTSQPGKPWRLGLRRPWWTRLRCARAILPPSPSARPSSFPPPLPCPYTHWKTQSSWWKASLSTEGLAFESRQAFACAGREPRQLFGRKGGNQGNPLVGHRSSLSVVERGIW